MNIQKWCHTITTLGPIGYAPASGTLASLVTMPLVYWLHKMLPNHYWYGASVVAIAVVSFFLIWRALLGTRRTNDPSEIVLDEVVGCLFVFIAVPLNLQTVVIGFMLFRLFDVSKIGGIAWVEQLNGSWGILGDDIAAALLSNLLLHLIF